MPHFISKLSICLTLTAMGCVTASLAAPALAQAGEPSAINKSDYDRAFRALKSDINSQIERKSTIYESTIKRERARINTALERMQRNDGVNIAPYQKEVDDFIKDAYARLKVNQLAKAKGRVDKNVPVVPALTGIDAIATMAPTWCSKGADFQKLLGRITMPRTHAELTLLTIAEAARFSCTLPDYEPVMKWTQAWRQHLSNTLGISRKENEALLKYASSSYKKLSYEDRVNYASKARKSMCRNLQAPKRNANREDIAEYKVIGSTLLCGQQMSTFIGDYIRFNEQSFWFIDVPGTPKSELGKLSLAHDLLLVHNSPFELMAPDRAKNPFRIINDFGVANSFGYNRKKALQEVAKLGFKGKDLWLAKMAVMGAAQDLEKAKHLVLKAAESNPAFKTIFIDAPKKGYANYANIAKGGKSALDLVLALEDSLINADGDLEGCADALYEEFRPWLKAYVKANKITYYKDLDFNSFTGSVLLHGLVTCATHQAETLPAMRSAFRDKYYRKTEIHRGPLSSAYQSMLSAYNDYLKAPPMAKKFSRSRGSRGKSIKLTHIYANPVSRPLLSLTSKTYTMDNSGGSSDLHGVIAKISKADSGYLKIVFKKEKYKSAIQKCTSTGRISYINRDGSLTYEQNCRITGYETLTRQNTTIYMPAWLAKGLKKGNLLGYRAGEPIESSDTKSYAFPFTAYKSKKAKKPIMILGVYLK